MSIELVKQDILKARTACIVFNVKNYPTQINDLVKLYGENYQKILYVTLNRLYNPLKRKIQQDKIDVSKFTFIDCVTKTAVAQPEEHEDCIYVTAPNALTELSIAITKSIQKNYPDVVLFDSLSTLLIYENPMIISQFIHSSTNKMNAFGVNIAFTILEGDKEQALIKDMGMFLDKVINIPNTPDQTPPK